MTRTDTARPTDQLEDPAALGAAFRGVFRRHPAGVAVVTADAGDGPVAMTITSLSSVSADPPLVMFSASSMSSSTPTLLAASSVVIHLLASDEVAVGRLAATSNIDRFADTSSWGRLPTGEPYYHAASARIVADVLERIPAGQGTIILARARQIADDRSADATALVYHDRGWHRLADSVIGH